MKKIITTSLVFLIIFVIFSGCTEIPSDLKNGGTSGFPDISSWIGWSKHIDNHGFSVYLPQGWSVNIDDSGLIRIGENPTENVGDLIIVWTIVLKKEKTEVELFNEIMVLLKSFIPNLEITSSRHVSEYNAYVGSLEYDNYIGVLILSINGSEAIVTGLAADKDRYNESLDNLIRVLYSFSYEPELMDPEAIGIVQMENWADPTEGAFSLSIPKGWTISSDSGITRPYLDAAVKIVLTKDDMGISIEQLHPPLYYTPNWILDLSGYPEGSTYAGGKVLSYHNARQYIESILPSELGLGAPVTITDRSDLLTNIYSAPWIQEKTAAEAAFKNGISYNVLVGDEYYELAGTGMWGISMVHYWASTDNLELVAKITNEVLLSFEIDDEWAKNEQRNVAIRTGLINELGDDIANMVKSTFEYRDSVLDETSRKFSNAILGIEDVYDPDTGEHWTVPSGSSSYWKDVYGDVYGSGSYTPPTNNDNWKELYCPDC